MYDDQFEGESRRDRKDRERAVRDLNKKRVQELNNFEANCKRANIGPNVQMIVTARLDALITHLLGPFETDEENEVVQGSEDRLRFEILVIEKMQVMLDTFADMPRQSGLVVPRG